MFLEDPMTPPVLYGYFRSSAAYRVRAALAWKGISFETRPVHLVKGEQGAPDYLALNPQGLVPVLRIDGHAFGQSMAILEYLEETRPEPALLPKGAADRAMVRWMTQLIVADIHPINNLRIANYLRGPLGQGDEAVSVWMRHWMAEGFHALETLAAAHCGTCCFGDAVSFADICLVPQMYNARRFGLDLADFPRLTAIDSHCRALPAFASAHPDNQVDSPKS
jgi:maleylacetoacetate isomerase